MDQKDIDRLLICRAAVDKHREFNKARVEAYTTCKSVTEAKTLIESKIGIATTISADISLKSPDAIKSTLEAERTKMTLAMYDVIKGQGFANYAEFADFNEKSNFEVFKECYPVIGKCDWCGEKEFAKQNCAVLFGLVGSCGEKRPASVTDQVAMSSYRRYILGETEVIDGVTCSISYCPKGHGYTNDVANFKTPPFDVFWRA